MVFNGVVDDISQDNDYQATISHALIRAGVTHHHSAVKNLSDIAQHLNWSAQQIGDCATYLGRVPDPDTALNALCGIVKQIIHCHKNNESDYSMQMQDTNSSNDLSNSEYLFSRLGHPEHDAFYRLISLLGSSEHLGHMMESRLGLIAIVVNDEKYKSHEWTKSEREKAFTSAINDKGSFSARVNALRYEYYCQLVAIAAFDCSNANPTEIQPVISRALSDLSDVTLEHALEIARSQVSGHELCRFSVVAMGKLGARELNYVSDVDLIYVVDKKISHGIADTNNNNQNYSIIKTGTKIGVMLQKICSSIIENVQEEPLWQIDNGLRPEGKDGPLVRTMTSYKSYYDKWAENWEFQALLKARCNAGDRQLGECFESLANQLVWTAASRPNFVFDCQQMRQRVEELIPQKLKDREIKLGRGGLRDVEFTLQMLQLVHGRSDKNLRVSSTLDALKKLLDGGYISYHQASELNEDYRFERVLEHREQLWRLKRTHLFPDLGRHNDSAIDLRKSTTVLDLDGNSDLRRLARVFHIVPEKLVYRYDSTRRQVRQLHLDIYYRPMLPQIAQMNTDEVSLKGEELEQRFSSIGFNDPQAAIRHVKAMTQGITRSAKINRIILPALLEWLGLGQNPDMGLLTLNKLEANFGYKSQYLGFLRDSPTAAERLCHVVSNSRYLGNALTKSIESLTWLGDDAQLQPRDAESLHRHIDLAVQRFDQRPDDFATSLLSLRRREIERVGIAWLNAIITRNQLMTAMTTVYDVLIDAALSWAIHYQCRHYGLEQSPVSICIIAVGRYGGREVNFASDADVMAIYDTTETNDNSTENENTRNSSVSPLVFSRSVINTMRSILTGSQTPEEALELDFDLRPEGRSGPIIRSLKSYQHYYSNWASVWEAQALLRARYCAGDRHLAAKFIGDIADPLRYSSHQMSSEDKTEIKKLKARMESERLPRGVHRDRHIKLGSGGLSDVEWTIQLLQLQWSYKYPDLQTVSTCDALAVAARHHLISEDDKNILSHAWKLETDTRNAHYLWHGKASEVDVLPTDNYSLAGIYACMNHSAHRGQEFENNLLSAMRRCRSVMERIFYNDGKENNNSAE